MGKQRKQEYNLERNKLRYSVGVSLIQKKSLSRKGNGLNTMIADHNETSAQL